MGISFEYRGNPFEMEEDIQFQPEVTNLVFQ